jgi:hypothetical protein
MGFRNGLTAVSISAEVAVLTVAAADIVGQIDRPQLTPAALAIAAADLTGPITAGQLAADVVPHIAGGLASYTFTGGSNLEHAITFPAGLFTAAPVVTSALRTGRVGLVSRITVAPTTAGVTLAVASVDSTAIDGVVYLNWIAFQP